MSMRLVHNTLPIAARMVHRLYILLPQEPFNYDQFTSTLSNKSFPVSSNPITLVLETCF